MSIQPYPYGAAKHKKTGRWVGYVVIDGQYIATNDDFATREEAEKAIVEEVRKTGHLAAVSSNTPEVN